MRSRGRHFRKPRRDADSLAPISSGRYRSVPLPRFRREVVALLVAAAKSGEHGPRLDSTHALRLVIKWDKMLRLRHSQGKPPCNVSDHILKYEKQGVVCPCGSAMSGARDKERGACRRCSRGGSRRDLPGRWKRTKDWRDRKIAEKREDFADMTHNVGEVTKAAARGRMPSLKDLRSVRTPIGGYRVGRDAYLTRDKLPASAFAIPERRAWPIHNERHARIALRYMLEGKGDRKDYPRIRRAIRARYGSLR